MSNQERKSAEEMRRQLLTHLRTLRNAGVEWLPMPNLDALPRGEDESSRESVPPASPVAQERQPAIVPIEPAASLLELAEEMPSDAGPAMTLIERQTALTVLADDVKGCTRCAELCSTRTQTVFGDGKPGVEICFLGEAPGADEDAQGLPFVGAAGQLLNKIISACGMKREEVYICNILKCRPPGNRTPLPNEAANCRAFLERRLELVNPKYIVALGSSAACNLLGTTLSVGKLRGRFHKYKEISVLVTYHPAYLLPHRSPEKKRDVWEDMKMLLTKMGRPIPER